MTIIITMHGVLLIRLCFDVFAISELRTCSCRQNLFLNTPCPCCLSVAQKAQRDPRDPKGALGALAAGGVGGHKGYKGAQRGGVQEGGGG